MAEFTTKRGAYAVYCMEDTSTPSIGEDQKVKCYSTGGVWITHV